MTIGYGDIVPTSNLERIYCIIITIISTGVYGNIRSFKNSYLTNWYFQYLIQNKYNN